MWDLIVSVPDHCLSFYFVIDVCCSVVTSVSKMEGGSCSFLK